MNYIIYLKYLIYILKTQIFLHPKFIKEVLMTTSNQLLSPYTVALRLR
jgi:hypothetical protein